MRWGATLTLCAGTWVLSQTVIIPKNLTLIGAGAGQTILDGNNAVRVLLIDRGRTAALQDLAITKGNAPLSIDGGGIVNFGTLTLVGVSVTGNSAGGGGGGIYNEGGTVTLELGSSVTGNTATLSGGGIYNFFTAGTVTLKDGSSVTGNTAGHDAGGGSGGGIFNFGTVTLEGGSRVTDNTAVGRLHVGGIGGGIYSDGSLTLELGSRVTGNTATRSGGGIYNDGSAILKLGAIVCRNSELQCSGDPVVGTCPSHSDADCPA